MKTVILKRVSHTEQATFGVLLYKGVPFCLSLELPWIDNKKNVSCIPEGVYTLFKRQDKRAYEFLSVPNRTDILIHVGNTVDDSEGCVLLGEEYEPLGDKIAVRSSSRALEGLGDILEGDEHFLLKICPPHRDEYII